MTKSNRPSNNKVIICALVSIVYRWLASAYANQFVTQIVNSPGLYFDQLLDVKFTNDNWNVITFIDLSHIQPHLESVEFLFDKVAKYCDSASSSQVKTDCLNSLNSLKLQHSNNIKKFSSISYLVQVNEMKRHKRGLIDAGGSLLKTVFGTLDSDDAHKFTNAINKVQSDEKQLTILMRDNIHVIKSTISTFNNTMSKVKENENRLNQNLNKIESAFNKLINTNDKLEIKSHLVLLLTSLESIIITLSFDIDDINNAILFSKINVLHPTVLSPMQLYKELELHANQLPRHAELPILLTLQNVNEIINISDIVCYYHDSKLIIVLKIPLVLSQVYNLFQNIPLPISFDNKTPDTYILIAPSKQYLAITIDRLFYSQFESVSECKVIKNQCFVCALNNVYSTIANPTCESILLTDVVDKLPKSCQTRILRGSIDLFQKISNNRWIFVQSEPSKGHIMCNDEMRDHVEILLGTGILHLPKSCKAFYKTLTFVPTDSITSNFTTTVSNFNILNDDCCDSVKLNKTLSEVPLIKLNEFNNFDSLLKASTHLNDFEQQLNKIAEPSHLEKYSTHYLSLTYVIATLSLLYFLFKIKKYVCPRNPGCCIKIYNKNYTKSGVSKNQVINTAYTSDSSEPEGDVISIKSIQTKRNTLK